MRRHLSRGQLPLHLAVALGAPRQKPAPLERQTEARGDEAQLFPRVVGLHHEHADVVAELAPPRHAPIAGQHDAVLFPRQPQQRAVLAGGARGDVLGVHAQRAKPTREAPEGAVRHEPFRDVGDFSRSRRRLRARRRRGRRARRGGSDVRIFSGLCEREHVRARRLGEHIRGAPEHQVRRAGAGVDVPRPERAHRRVHQHRDGRVRGGSPGVCDVCGVYGAVSEPQGGHRSRWVPEDPDALLGRGEPHFALRDAEPRRHRAQVHAVGAPKHQQRRGHGAPLVFCASYAFFRVRVAGGGPVGERSAERRGDGGGGPRPGRRAAVAVANPGTPAGDHHAYALDHRVHRDAGAERGGGVLRGRAGLGREPNRRRVDAQRREKRERRRRRVRRRERLRDVVAVVKVFFIDRLRISGNRTFAATRLELERRELALEKVVGDARDQSALETRIEHRGDRRGGVFVARDGRGVFHRGYCEHTGQEPHEHARVLRGVPSLCGAQRPAVPVRARLGLVEGRAQKTRRRRGETGKARQTGVATDGRRRAQRLQTHGSGDRRECAPERRRPGPSGAAQVLREPEPEHDRGLVSFPRVLAFVPSLLSTGSFPLPRGAQDRAERLVDHVRGAAQTQTRHVQQRHRPLARELKQGRFVFPGRAALGGGVRTPLRVESDHGVSRQAVHRAAQAPRVIREHHRAARQIQGQNIARRVLVLVPVPRRIRRIRRQPTRRVAEPGHRRAEPGVLPRERGRHLPPALRAQPAQARLFSGPVLLRERGGEAQPAHAPLGALDGGDPGRSDRSIERRVRFRFALSQASDVPLALASRQARGDAVGERAVPARADGVQRAGCRERRQREVPHQAHRRGDAGRGFAFRFVFFSARRRADRRAQTRAAIQYQRVFHLPGMRVFVFFFVRVVRLEVGEVDAGHGREFRGRARLQAHGARF